MKYVLRTHSVDINKLTVDGCPIMFVDTPEKAERVNRMLDDAERVGLDTEFYGHESDSESPFGKCKPVSMQLSARGPKVDDVNWARMIMVPNWDGLRMIKYFKKFLGDERHRKVLHNAKVDFHPLDNIGCPVRGLRADTLVKAYILNSSPYADHSLKGMVGKIIGKDLPDYAAKFKVPKFKQDGTPGKQLQVANPYELVSGAYDWYFAGSNGMAELTKYAVKDPLLTLDLEDYLDDSLRDLEWVGGRSMYDYYVMFEREFTEVLYSMERTGLYVNAEAAHEVRAHLEDITNKAERSFFKHCIKLGLSKARLLEINEACKGKSGLLGGKALGKLLVEEFGLKLPMGADGSYSTKAENLSKNKAKKHQDIVKAILTWKELTKLLGTYMIPFCRFAEEDVYQNRVRTTLKQTGTVGGRLSSVAVNMQNIPTRTELGQMIRSIFQAPAGYVFADGDLSQIELRIAAHQSKDPTMIATFKNNIDPHSRTAVGAFSDVKKFVTDRMGGVFDVNNIDESLYAEIQQNFKAERSKAKTLNFLTLYGGGASRYAAQTGSSVEEGERVIKNFFKMYPLLKKDMARVLQCVRQNGWVRTAYLKRYAHFPAIASRDSKVRSHAERGAYNATIQGGGADIMKLAMICIHRDKRMEEWGVRMGLQVHDELCFEIPEDIADKVAPILKDYIAHPYNHLGLKPLLVDTPADFHIGKNWRDTH